MKIMKKKKWWDRDSGNNNIHEQQMNDNRVATNSEDRDRFCSLELYKYIFYLSCSKEYLYLESRHWKRRMETNTKASPSKQKKKQRSIQKR